MSDPLPTKRKPIRVFYSPSTGRLWASQHYRDDTQKKARQLTPPG
jgi:hypothetical protein